MTVDVIIPTFNNRDELRDCLDSLDAQQHRPFRVLVCIDGSTDGTIEELTSVVRTFPLVVLQHPDGHNHGRAAARNLALTELKAPHVLLLDSDMRLAPDGLARHVELLSRRDCVSIGDIHYAPIRGDLWARYQATRGRRKFEAGKEVRWLDMMSANTALRSGDLLAVGGFDVSLAGYGGEDTELGLRLAEQRSLPFIFNASAVAETVERKSVTEGLAQLDRFARTNLRAIRSRHPSGPAPFWVDRLDSPRPVDRILRMALNPLTDAVVRFLLMRVPFTLQRRLLDYLVIRTVFRGYVEGPR